MKLLKIALLAGAVALGPAGAHAQSVGTTIYGSDGKPVGTVAEANAQVLVIDTGTHEAPVPVNLVFDGEKGKSVNATREQVDAMMAERLAEAGGRRDTALRKGAAVVSAGGRDIGTLAEVDLAANSIILASPEGPLRLKKEHFAVGREGQLTVLYSRDQIVSAAGGGRTGGSR